MIRFPLLLKPVRSGSAFALGANIHTYIGLGYEIYKWEDYDEDDTKIKKPQ